MNCDTDGDGKCDVNCIYTEKEPDDLNIDLDGDQTPSPFKSIFKSGILSLFLSILMSGLPSTSI